VFNITRDHVSVNRYIGALADVVGEKPNVVYLPDELLPEVGRTVFGHLFGVRHHAIASIEKAERLLGLAPHYDLKSGHEHTYEWFRSKGFADVDSPMIDPMWKASWDFDAEEAIAERVRGA
jgi:nucleoside-diphosphate-sugar epimerase